MTTPEIRESEIKGFIRTQRDQGGVVPSKLVSGTTLLIETKQYMYQIKALDMTIGRRYMLDTASPVCKNEHVVIDIKAHWRNYKYNMPDWIGRDMCMIFTFATGMSVITGEVRGLKLSAPGKDGQRYNFEFWEDNELS